MTSVAGRDPAAAQGDDLLRHNGAGEMLVFSAADFELFNEPRPELPPELEPELHDVVKLLVEKRWPFRIHATYDEHHPHPGCIRTGQPRGAIRWPALVHRPRRDHHSAQYRAHPRAGWGIAVQHRMAYQGEAFVERYGVQAARHTPPVKRMLAEGVPVGAGTGATRVASYNPWVALSWLVTGRTVGGLACMARKTCSNASRRCACGPRAAPGSPATKQ